MAKPNPEYLGDGCYATFDGWHLWLESPDNEVALEWSVFQGMLRYAERCWGVRIEVKEAGPSGPEDAA